MNYILKETLIIISLNLKPRYLALVCKNYELIYDEFWYCQYLIQRYDEAEITGTEFSYRELCRRSLLESDIYIHKYHSYIHKYHSVNLDDKLPIRGIKAASIGFEHYILKFNGELYKCFGNVTEFIDNNVVDINKECYIKKSELYIYKDENGKYKSISFSTTSAIQELQYIYTIYNDFYSINYYQFYTSDTIYWNYYTEDIAKIRNFTVTDGISKAYTVVRDDNISKAITYILTNKNTLVIYFNNKFTIKPRIISNISDLGKNYICIDNKYYYFNPYDIKFNFNFRKLVLLNCVIQSSICGVYDVLIIDNKIVWINHCGKIIESFKIDCSVKRIMSGRFGNYIVKE